MYDQLLRDNAATCNKASTTEQKASFNICELRHKITQLLFLFSLKFLITHLITEDAGHMPSTGNLVPYTPLAEKPPAELKSSQASVIQLYYRQLVFLIRGILKISQEFFLQLNAFGKHMFIHENLSFPTMFPT